MYMKKRGGSWFMKMFQKEQPASSPATSNNKQTSGSVTAPDINKPVTPTPTPTNNSKPSQLGGSRRRKRRKTLKSRRK